MTRVCIVIRDNGGGAPAFEEACARVCTHVCVCVCVCVSRFRRYCFTDNTTETGHVG